MEKFGLKTEIVPTEEYAADHVDIHPLSVGDRGGFFLIEGDEVEGLEFQSVPIGGVSVQFESFHFSCFLGYTFFSCLLIQR